MMVHKSFNDFNFSKTVPDEEYIVVAAVMKYSERKTLSYCDFFYQGYIQVYKKITDACMYSFYILISFQIDMNFLCTRNKSRTIFVNTFLLQFCRFCSLEICEKIVFTPDVHMRFYQEKNELKR